MQYLLQIGVKKEDGGIEYTDQSKPFDNYTQALQAVAAILKHTDSLELNLYIRIQSKKG